MDVPNEKTRRIESEEQGRGGFVTDDHGAEQPMMQIDAFQHGPVGSALPAPASAVQALQLGMVFGNELAALRAEQSGIRRMVEAHNENLAGVNRALGEFRDKVMAPIKEELGFLRYNLGDRANTTVSQMTGVLTHLDKLFEAIARMGGMDPGQIVQLREEMGIPKEIPSLAELEATGRPAVDYDAMHSQIAQLTQQNSRLLASIERNQKELEHLRGERDSFVQQFLGYLSVDLAELRQMEVRKLAASYQRFKERLAELAARPQHVPV